MLHSVSLIIQTPLWLSKIIFGIHRWTCWENWVQSGCYTSLILTAHGRNKHQSPTKIFIVAEKYEVEWTKLQVHEQYHRSAGRCDKHYVSLGIQLREAAELWTHQELENRGLQDCHEKWWHSQEEKGTRSVDFTSARRKSQESAIQSTNHVHEQ